MRLTFPRKQRLRGYKKFHKVLSEGKKFSNQFFLISVLPCKSEINQFGVGVSRKIKLSVKRNKLKRIVREIYRLHQHSFIKGISMVVIAKDKDLNYPFNELKEGFLALCKKGKFFKQ